MTSASPRAALRGAVTAGGPVVGTFVKLPGRASIDLAHRGGYAFVVIDLEHSTLTEGQAADQVAHARALGLAAVVRLTQPDAGVINRFLELGAAGIQLSTLRTAADAEALRAGTRYSPEGLRSVSLAHPEAAYGTVRLADYVAAEAAAPPLVVGQIETATTDDPLEALVPHLDVAFLGTTDLTVDLGVPGQLEHPTVQARIAQIGQAAADAGIALGAFAGSAAELPALQALGASYFVVGSDLAMLGKALTTGGAEARSFTTAEDPA